MTTIMCTLTKIFLIHQDNPRPKQHCATHRPIWTASRDSERHRRCILWRTSSTINCCDTHHTVARVSTSRRSVCIVSSVVWLVDTDSWTTLCGVSSTGGAPYIRQKPIVAFEFIGLEHRRSGRGRMMSVSIVVLSWRTSKRTFTFVPCWSNRYILKATALGLGFFTVLVLALALGSTCNLSAGRFLSHRDCGRQSLAPDSCEAMLANTKKC